MNVLLINTCTKNNELALFTEEKLLNYRKWEANRDESDKLVMYIEDLLKDEQKSFSDLTHVVVLSGPGGFTSTRVGVTIANTIAYSQKIPITGIDLFSWWKITNDSDIHQFSILHSITKHNIFSVSPSDTITPDFIPKQITIEEFLAQDHLAAHFMGDMREEHERLLKENNWEKLETNIENFIPHIKNITWNEVGIVEPFYGREGQIN